MRVIEKKIVGIPSYFSLARGSGTDKGLDCGATAAGPKVQRTYRIAPDRGGNNKRLSIVDDKRLKRARRAFHHGFFTLDEIENVHAASRIMFYYARKPMASRLDELAPMQPGAFLPPALPGAERFDRVDQMAFDPLRRAIPLDIGGAVLRWMGRGLPSRPRRPQSHILKVKI